MRRMKPSLPVPLSAPLSAVALLLLTACAGGHADTRTAAADSNPLAMEGLMVLSEDGERMLGTVDDVIAGPDGRPARVIVASRPPAFAVGDRVSLAAEDLIVSTDRSAAVLTGLTPQEFADLATGDDMIALSGASCAGCSREPTDWSGLSR